MAPRKRPARLRPGTPVASTVGVRGEVVRHVPGADGGSYTVRWVNGHQGRIAPNQIRPTPVLVDDPNGYVVSENYGDNLYHYDTLERAIQGAKDAVTEGAEAADVWHSAPTTGVEIDYDQEIEYSVRQTNLT